MSIRYRNLTTGKVAVYAHRMRRLDRSDRWEMIEDDAAPARSAVKADWDAHARSVGVDTEGMTKDDIIEALGR